MISFVSDKMYEILTNVNFDYSDIRIYDYYSKIFRRNIIKEKIKRSSEPIHVSLYSEELTDYCVRNINYRNVSSEDILEYKNEVIDEFGSIENYKNYLLYLKEIAYGTLENAVRDFNNQKTLTKSKGVINL